MKVNVRTGNEKGEEREKSMEGNEREEKKWKETGKIYS